MIATPRLALAALLVATAPTITTAAPARAAPAAAWPSVTVPAVDLAAMQGVVKTLASDAFEGRAPSTRAEPKVLAYVIAQFKAAGLKPGGVGGDWTQDVPTVEIAGTNHTPLAIAGGAAPLSFAFGDDYVAASYRVVPHTAIRDADLVFVGFGINAPELGWNDYAGVDMHGKVAVILVNDPDYETADESGPFKGRRMTYYGRWTYKFEEAARQGAKAALIVHQTFPAAYGWNVVHSSWTNAQYRVQTANDGADQTEANGWIQQAVAQKIFAAAGKDFAGLSAAAKQRGFRAVSLGLKASFGFDNAVRRALSHNVIGIQPGAARPQEYVLYSAHWDHLGRCAPDARGDDICNGAVDNATGVGALTALARMNAKAGPAARSQVFVALTLEESGLLGSEWYAAHPVYPLAQTAGGVNMDALFPTPRARDYAMTGGDKSELTALFRDVLKEEGLSESGEDHVERGHYYRSDHFSLAKRGVPMFDLGRGTDLVNGGKAAGAALYEDYTAHRYHQPSDEYSPGWDWSGIAEDLRVYYKLGRKLAMSRAWPNWHPGDEFRAARDASRKDGR